jgi:crotonobetainyl-CoA:carnitine CoA-transferase CaiB-like acyl-CoA transferase
VRNLIMANFMPLRGIVVLDFSKILAGPLCTQYLGALGADVIKVEALGIGDDTRAWPPFTDGDGAVFLSVNSSKRSIAVDLKSARGQEICKRLAAKADIAIENFGPGVAARLGIDHASLARINPRLISCSISGFGTQGAMKNAKGYDVILQAFSGMLSITGAPDGPPARTPFSPVDQATGLHAVIGILGALLERSRTGKGMDVHASLFDSAVSFLGYVLQGFWQLRVDPKPAGSGHESLCPYQAFETCDKPLILGIANDALWAKFCHVVGLEDLVEDDRFKTAASRVLHREETVAIVQNVLSQRSRAQWLAVLDQAGIPCSPVHTISELANHPHTAASEMFMDCTRSTGESIPGLALPLRIDGQRLTGRSAPPKLGDSTEEVLESLGFDAEEIASLLAEGIVEQARA